MRAARYLLALLAGVPIRHVLLYIVRRLRQPLRSLPILFLPRRMNVSVSVSMRATRDPLVLLAGRVRLPARCLANESVSTWRAHLSPP